MIFKDYCYQYYIEEKILRKLNFYNGITPMLNKCKEAIINDFLKYKKQNFNFNNDKDFRNFINLFKEYTKLKKIILFNIKETLILTYKNP